MSLKTGSRWSNWAWDKPVKAFIWRSSRICRPIGGLPPWFFEDSLPHLLLRNNSNVAGLLQTGSRRGFSPVCVADASPTRSSTHADASPCPFSADIAELAPSERQSIGESSQDDGLPSLGYPCAAVAV